MILEDACEMIDRFINGDGWVCINPQYEAGGEITHGERETIVAILQTELPFIVCSPDVIRPLRNTLRAPGMRSPVPASWFHQPGPGENPCSRRHRRKQTTWIPVIHYVQELRWTPAGMLLLEFDQFLHNRFVRLPGTAMWTARLILQAALSVLLISFDPFMRCLAGDAKSLSEFCFRVEVQKIIFDESLSLFTHGNTFSAPTSSWRKCYPCL